MLFIVFMSDLYDSDWTDCSGARGVQTDAGIPFFPGISCGSVALKKEKKLKQGELNSGGQEEALQPLTISCFACKEFGLNISLQKTSNKSSAAFPESPMDSMT